MKQARLLTDKDLIEKAVKILIEKLGEVEATRFAVHQR